MEDSRFDELTKAIATPTSRRQTLKAFLATTMGGFLALTGFGDAAASSNIATDCKGLGDKCAQDKQCCLGYCDPGTGTCACPSGSVFCNGSCVSTTCSGGQVFNPNVCSCPSGTILCNGSCISPTCSGGQVFDFSTCTCGCPPGTTLCNGSCISTTCCGGQVLNASTCSCECPSGTILANGACVPTCPCKSGCQCQSFTIDGGPTTSICVTPSPSKQCFTDLDCPQGSICVSGEGCVILCS